MTSQERPAGRGQRKDDVLRELRADGALTAAELVERTSLSRPTIISLLRELEEDGWVSSEVGGHGAPGRPATAWAPASRAGIVIGADVLVDSMLTVVSTFSRESSRGQDRPTPSTGVVKRGSMLLPV